MKLELNVKHFSNEDVIATSGEPVLFKIEFEKFDPTPGTQLYPGGPYTGGTSGDSMMKVLSGAEKGDKIVTPNQVTYTVIQATQGGDPYLWLSENGLNRSGAFTDTQARIYNAAEYAFDADTNTYTAQ